MRFFVAIAVTLVLSTCSMGPAQDPYQLVACTVDVQCRQGQVCFPDGCGDPGKNIVVEVTGNG
ncbi:MAG: hypothetical protein JNK82_25510, partial [Myxococcaceae bacterium]|nr:hypothetical protein [Myxococcaceae bacterium]